MRVPFFIPYLTGAEIPNVIQSIQSLHWSGDGPSSKKCSELLRTLTGHPVFLTTSGTHSLELSLMALNLEPESEVILPSFTFVSSANAAVQLGLRPIFIDIREDTLNLDERLIEKAITQKTRAILVVHYAGVAAEMDAINDIARKYKISVIEDAAHGVNAFYKGRALGSLGDLGCFSFHQTKNISCGEGGALVVSNERFLSHVEIHREKGTDRSRFLAGRTDKYTWVDRGSSYLMSDLLAAFLQAQLSAMDQITAKRKAIYERYMEAFADLACDALSLPCIPNDRQSNYHLFHVLVRDASTKTEFMKYMRESGVEVATHFIPLHSSPGGQKFGETRSSLRVTSDVYEALIRLPLYPQLSEESQAHVIRSVRKFFRVP